MKISLFTLLFFIAISIYGQNTKLFRDNYGLQGEVKYRGEWHDSLLPLQGSYDLKWRDRKEENIKTYRVKGVLKAHLPQGKWSWEEADWVYTIEPGNDLTPVLNTKGLRKSWQGNFVRGLPDGVWKFTQDSLPRIPNSKGAEVEWNALWKAGQLSGKQTLKDARQASLCTFSIELNEKGEAHGKWEITYQADTSAQMIRESRTYQSGVLIAEMAQYLSPDSVFLDTIYEERMKRLEQLISNQKEVSDLNFRIGEMRFAEDEFYSSGLTKVYAYLSDYLLKGWGLEVFQHEVVRNSPVFRRFEYPLSSDEQKFIQTSLNEIKRMHTHIRQRLNYRNIRINRGKSPELDLAVAFLDHATDRLEAIDSLLQTTQDSIFTYINRNHTGTRGWRPYFSGAEMIAGDSYDSLTTQWPMLPADSYDTLTFDLIFSYISQIDALLKGHLEVMDASLIALQKEGELQALEDKLTMKLAETDSLYATLEGSGRKVNEQWVHVYLREILQEYAQSQDYITSFKIGAQLELKMDSLISCQPFWQVLDSMEHKLNEQYTQLAYNPYTGKHDIELRLKKRFYNKVSTDFWPWLKNSLLTQTEWDAFIAMKLDLESAFQRLMVFAEEDDKPAKRLEKRIRDESNYDRILRLLLE